MLSYRDISSNAEILTYIEMADKVMQAMGYTEHSLAHVGRTAKIAWEILHELGFDGRSAELAQIAGLMHDIGNAVNRKDHAQSGALMAFWILTRLGMPAGEVAAVVSAIGNHDESTAFPVNAQAAALILADKSDVRRSRVRSRPTDFDIHDRVNYAVIRSRLKVEKDEGVVFLRLNIDTEICSVMDYFEIFLGRMLLCRKAAEFFALKFVLIANETKLT
jgi:HD superfamily phosphodiesterase